MTVILVSYSDSTGGAARAAYRVHRALRESEIDSRMWVVEKTSTDDFVEGASGNWTRLRNIARSRAARTLVRRLKTSNPTTFTAALLPSGYPHRLNHAHADLVHLHWIGGEMLSVGDIHRVRKPLVWTFHDMWAFCGAEHYAEDFRWRDQYRRTNRPSYESGFDLNGWTWRRKVRAWRTPIHIVAPSRWMASCVSRSPLTAEWPVTVVPNPVDTEVWRPVEKLSARRLIGVPTDRPVVLFGAVGGTGDSRKGFDLLRDALGYAIRMHPDLYLVVFGEQMPAEPLGLPCEVHYAGRLHDDLSLRMIYSAADAFLIPSRQDNLPNTGIEALACGTPVVAFDAGGLRDIVTHQRNGYLCRPFEVRDLAEGLSWVIANPKRATLLAEQARRTAVEKFSNPVVARAYRHVYEEAIGINECRT